ncbi:MAG TPA: hypothetical protein VMT04_00785 [Terriglobales bacterium]|nr:hypothetical protein [Terriglobales bacterium]
MRKLILLVISLVLLVVLFVIKNKANNVQQETYRSESIIDAPWGKEPGQFGIYDPLEHGEGGPIVGPQTLTVAVNGDIYIYDAQNGRIQRFNNNGQVISIIPLSKNGEEICVDQSGNIYLYDSGIVPKTVSKFDEKGNLLIVYPISWDDLGMRVIGGVSIYCNKSGGIFLSYRSDSLKTPMIFEVGTTDMVFSPEQQKATLKEGFVGSNNVVLNQGAVFQTKTGQLELVGDSSGTVKKFNAYRMNFGQAGFTGVDNQMNVYTASGNIIRKYSPAGDLMAEFTIQKEDYILSTRSLYLDEHGNVYLMSTSKDGLKIIKWSPVGVK